MNPREEENRRTWAAGEPSRADAGLRQPFQICPRCDGGGYILGRVRAPPSPENPYACGVWVDDPVKCDRCNGEGLDPASVPRTR